MERRLQELEREMHGEQRSTGGERRPEQRAAASDEPQEVTLLLATHLPHLALIARGKMEAHEFSGTI